MTDAKTVVAGIPLTHPDRVLYPEQGVTKLELARYYEAVAAHLLPHLRGRPLSLVRCPAGREKACFYQKHLGPGFSAAVDRVEIEEKDGSGVYGIAGDLGAVIALVQMGTLELHTWGCRADRLERPDRLVFDLDPAPGVGWELVIEGAREIRRRLADLGLESFVKTTGGKGLHLVAPLVRRHGWDEVRAFSRAFAERLADEHPERFLATASKEKRRGRIFVDWLRNSRGATAVAAYSTRARPGAPVSTPVGWDELAPELPSDAFGVRNLPARLRSLAAEPWAGYAELRQSITAAARRRLGL